MIRTPLWLKILSSIAWVGLCLLSVGCGTVLSLIKSSAVTSEILTQKAHGTKPEQVFDRDSITLLVLGCDKDLYYGGKQTLNTSARSDMMMVAKLDFKNKKITGLSIPRDIAVDDMPGFKRMRINGFHALGGKSAAKGREYSKMVVEHELGIPIDRVMELNFDKFQEIIDDLGGVDVFVDKDLKYTDKAGGLFIDIKHGRQHLDGYNAMCFVRYRHGDTDFMRQDRQKALMYSVKERLMHSPGRLGTVADKMRAVLGNEITAPEIAAIALFAQSIGNDNIKLGQVPTVECVGGQRWDLSIDEQKLAMTLRKFNFSGDRAEFREQS